MGNERGEDSERKREETRGRERRNIQVNENNERLTV